MVLAAAATEAEAVAASLPDLSAGEVVSEEELHTLETTIHKNSAAITTNDAVIAALQKALGNR